MAFESGDFVVWSRRHEIFCGKVLHTIPTGYYNLKVHQYTNAEKKPLFNLNGDPMIKVVKTGRVIKVKQL